MAQSPAPSAEILRRLESAECRHTRRLRIALWGAALLLGAFNAWALRYQLNPDAVSYLDLADASLKHGLMGVVNAYWSPLYPLLLRFGLRVVEPAGRWDAPAAHFVNFVIYVAALGSFDFFWHTLRESRRDIADRASADGSTMLPDWAFLSLGFALFVWTSLQLVNLSGITPDLCIVAFVYLASALVVRIHMQPAKWSAFLALGLVLGVGYLVKAPFFLMAGVYLGVSAAIAVRVGNVRTALLRVGTSFLLFLIVAGPLVLVLSRTQGHMTFGESGRINYGWYADSLPLYGDAMPPPSRSALHPPRKILENPAVFEFATPIKGTYPLWDDPAYWWAGEKIHFDWPSQLSALKTNMVEYYQIFVIAQAGLLAGITVLLVFGGRGLLSLRDIAEHWYLWIPAVAGMAMYAPVHLESRFIAGYVMLFWAAVLLGIRLPSSPEAKRVAAAAAIAILLTLGLQIGWQAIDDVKVGIAGVGKDQCEVAAGLRRMGVEPGDKVAMAGNGLSAFWARIARVSIVAETPDYGGESFWWAADPSVKAQVFQAFAKTGAKALVTDRIPVPDWTADWQQVGNTDCYVHFLRKP